MPQVLVVGAGPVGETSKALVVWARTLELMDRMGCTPGFLDAGLRAHGASMRKGGKILGHISLDSIASQYDFALMIPQRDTEQLLASHLKFLGVTVERQAEMQSFTEGPDHVEVLLRHADGREETIATPWLIGCDGAHSTVRHGLGIKFLGIAQADDWILADVRLEGEGAPPGNEVAIYLHHGGPFVIFPIPGGRARVIAAIGKTDTAHPRPDPALAEVQALVDSRAGGGFRVVDPVWLANFHINERKVADYRQGRIFLAGDAAHIHSPAGGQGMNTGMQDAFNLAWKLAMVMQGAAAKTLLDSYSPERSAVGELVLRNAGRLTDLATLTNPAAQAARNLALRLLLGLHIVEDRMAATMSEIEIAYGGSPLSVGHKAGVRLAPEHYRGPPPGAGRAPRFVLYAADTEKGAALAAQFPSLLEPEPRTPTAPHRLLIARPDGYVGLSADGHAWEEAERYLERLAPVPA